MQHPGTLEMSKYLASTKANPQKVEIIDLR
jgi:hypothetical protein